MTRKINTWLNKAVKSFETKHYELAESLCRKIFELEPNSTAALGLFGKICFVQKRYDEASGAFSEVLQTIPGEHETLIHLIQCYKELGDYNAMIKAANCLAKLDHEPENLVIAYSAFLATCSWEKASELQARVLDVLENGDVPQEYVSGTLLNLNTLACVDPRRIFNIHKYWGEKNIEACKATRLSLTPTPPPKQRIKIGYLSADFNQHPVGHLIKPILEHHDRSRFDVYCYAHLHKDDIMTGQFRNNIEHFVDITAMSHAEAAMRINQDGIHILVDLGGHTAFSQLPLLGFKPAPVQISYLGYPNTTGLTTVDFRITDRHADVKDGTIYTEELLRMPESFITMYGLPNVPRTEKTPAEDNGYVTFGSFNNIRKLNSEVIKLWSSILRQTQESRILIKSSGCESPVIRQNILDEFAKNDIDSKRIEFGKYTHSYEEHADQYNRVDIALDTFPYHGTHTTCEALWMGVPVITLEGRMHVQRVSSAILKNIGYDVTIATCEDEYVAKAVDLASRPENLSIVRKCLHTLFRHSIVCQPQKVTRQLEDQYVHAWEIKMGEQPSINLRSEHVEVQNTVEEPSSDTRITLATLISQVSGMKETTIAEVGARIINEPGSGEPPEIFHKLQHAKVIAFEPDSEACEKVNGLTDSFAANIHAYPYALGLKNGQQTLYVTQDGMCSSLYKPNETMMRRFEALEVAYLKEEIPIDVVSLDDFIQTEKINDIDFIKIDVQGAELDVFKGGEHALQGIIGICTEVEWAELYEGQPLFADVDLYLREHGLQMHHFIGGETRPLNGPSLPGIQQHLWSDAVYFPSFERIETLSTNKLIKLAVMATLYDAYDLAMHALKRYDTLTGSKLSTMVSNHFHPAQETQTSTGSHEMPTHTTSPSLSLPIEGGVQIVVPNDLNLMTPYILTEQQDWFEDEIKFIRKLIKPDMKVLDIGANYGCYAMTMANLIGDKGHLWAFEPASSTVSFLTKSISTNGFGNVTLIKAALSNHKGTAELSLVANSELNSIASGAGNGSTESVPLMRLDDCIDSYQWKNIEFVKMDAEGEEIHILEGGSTFFSSFSPLVMFELKHGDQINEGLIQKFMDYGYRTYALVPGLQTLAPFNHEDRMDPYQLNLFCCKDDRASELEQTGLLIRTMQGDNANIPEGEHWREMMQFFPYAKELIPLWDARMNEGEPLPGWPAYREALNAYALSRQPGPVAKRHAYLKSAFVDLVSLLDEHVNLPRLLTLARVATELGQRSAAVQILNEISKHFEQEPNFIPGEPFLAVSTMAEYANPQGRLGDWCLTQVLAQRERLQAFSSYFTGDTSLPSLNLFLQLGFEDTEMHRRCQLIKMRQEQTSAQQKIREVANA